MADFSVRATSLTPAQGAGSQPIQAVGNTNNPPPDLGFFGQLIGGLGRTEKSKNNPWDSTVNEYAGKATTILQAQSTGDIDARTANLKMQQLTTEYQRMGKDYGLPFMKAISEANGYLRTGTNLGTVESAAQAAESELQTALKGLAEIGVPTTPSDQMTPSERANTLSLAQNLNATRNSLKMAEDRLAAERATQNHVQGTVGWNQSQEDRTIAVSARQNLMKVQSDTLALTFDKLKAFMQNPDKRQAAMDFEGTLVAFDAQAQNMLMNDPAAMGSYRDSMAQMRSYARLLLDPATNTKDLQNEVASWVTSQQLSIVTSDGQARTISALSDLAPHTTWGTLANEQVGMRWLKDDLAAAENRGPLPSILTGNTDAQRLVFGSAQKTVDMASSGKLVNPERAMDSASSVFVGATKALAATSNSSPQTVAYTLDLLGSEQNEKLVKSGRYDPQAAQEAVPVFRNMIVNEFGKDFYYKFMNAPLNGIGNWYSVQERLPEGLKDEYNSLSNFINFDVNDRGQASITAALPEDLRREAGVKLSAGMEQTINRQAKEQAASLTKIIRTGALLEGRTDFKQYFEENKSNILRGVYPPANELDFYKKQGYNGTGNIHNPINWTPGTSFKGATKFNPQRAEPATTE